MEPARGRSVAGERLIDSAHRLKARRRKYRVGRCARVLILCVCGVVVPELDSRELARKVAGWVPRSRVDRPWAGEGQAKSPCCGVPSWPLEPRASRGPQRLNCGPHSRSGPAGDTRSRGRRGRVVNFAMHQHANGRLMFLKKAAIFSYPANKQES